MIYGTVPGRDFIKRHHGHIKLCPRHLPECGEELHAPCCTGVSLYPDTVHHTQSKGLGWHIQGEIQCIMKAFKENTKYALLLVVVVVAQILCSND